ncbi:GNAT family N-acetyltransferase [Nocardioides rotundus]|uniref:GNAT family N-acetyltransferase n=1 Tax=Nocardioides rotundus TaxID=1774216 RepID=UPI001CBFFBD0|nr:GNAT family N-acetyltransferase [Nocardioides rotundus]UAL31454.1 GNAT family N-acetyltransferase [Nocardioides rotundus]
MLETRALSSGDWRLWRELRLAALADAPTAFCARLADWQGAGDREERWRDRLSIPGARDIVAFLEDRPVGMATGVPGETSSAVGLISMWVNPAARGRGVGDRLIQAVEEYGVERGARTLGLTVMPDNAAALAFYARNGFTESGEQGPLRPDGVTRELVLSKGLHRSAGAPKA